MKKIFLSLLFVWQFLKFIREHEKNKFSKFGPLTWPRMTSSNLGPFFHGQTLINWKCFNFFKNQYFWTKFGHKVYFYVWNTLNIRKLQFLQKFPIFPIFPIFPKIPILDHFWAKIPDREIYLMPSNVMILLVLPYIYHLPQKLRLYQF